MVCEMFEEPSINMSTSHDFLFTKSQVTVRGAKLLHGSLYRYIPGCPFDRQVFILLIDLKAL